MCRSFFFARNRTRLFRYFKGLFRRCTSRNDRVFYQVSLGVQNPLCRCATSPPKGAKNSFVYGISPQAGADLQFVPHQIRARQGSYKRSGHCERSEAVFQGKQ